MRITGLGLTAILDDSTVNTIAQAIQTQEGYYPGSLAYENNNPGNLIFAGQHGAVVGAGGFAKFPDYSTGYQALLDQIQRYASRGYTIQQMMNVYLGQDKNATPGVSSQGDSALYASNVAGALGVTPDTRLSDLSAVASSPSTEFNPYSLSPGEVGFSPVAVFGLAAAGLVGILLLSR